MLTAINKQNPTSTTYVLSLLLFCMTSLSYGQAVFEEFDGFTSANGYSETTFGNYTYNDFEITRGRAFGVGGYCPSCVYPFLPFLNGTNIYGGSAVSLYASTLPIIPIPTSTLEYVGTDGNGKDGGVGTISFFWRTFAGFAGFRFAIEVNVDGGGYMEIGEIANINGNWTEFTYPLNITGDNIKIRIVRDFGSDIGQNQILSIDYFTITDFALEATWTGTTWVWNDSTPDGTIPTFLDKANVFINGNYNTSVGGLQQSFGGANLTVNSGFELTIADGTFVEIDKNLTVNGSIVVESKGSFVQVDDSGVVDGDVLSDRTKIKVKKETSLLASAFEYTYWSSPVSGESLSTGLEEANPGRIYLFDAQNYLDQYAETTNDNVDGPGIDDIDDNGDDWQPASGVMTRGVGYAATHSATAFANATGCPSCRITYTFEGPFNTGDITVPIYRNDDFRGDNNWNFIGNPYPSAIDAIAFLDENTGNIDESTLGAIDGAIFFWSHKTGLDADFNGNDSENFAQADYAVMNRAGSVVNDENGDPTLQYIPSGQGFFVSMNDDSPPASSGVVSGNVVFNNSMRVTGNNTQFFRSSGNIDPNKLWVNLTSDNGVFNQILVAYVNGATDYFDGMYYDAYKNLSTGLYSEIYTSIADSPNKRFAIQGKDPNSLTLDEVIPFGFNTSIAVPTLYTISIGQFEGAFMTANTIYLKDNLLNTIHNLKDSDYTFTSEVGDFDTRFEIVFTPQALSVDENLLDSDALTITELTTTDVAFNVGKGFSITNVKIFDLLGRQIYDLEGSSSREVYNLAKLSKAAYIAKVTLDNGQVLSKKAIKQK